MQGCRKIGCHAHIVIKECVLYPEYRIDRDEKKFAIRTLYPAFLPQPGKCYAKLILTALPFIEVNKEDHPRETAPPTQNKTNGDEDSNTIHETASYKQQLLWVHHTNWQKQLLVRYGNVISLIDATCKTTKYVLALFFICVRMNVGHSVEAEFIVQSESADNIDIEEDLQELKSWNPEWNPRFLHLIIRRPCSLQCKLFFQVLKSTCVTSTANKPGYSGAETTNMVLPKRK